MNENEAKLFSAAERALPDATQLPATFLLKSLFVKVRRHLGGSLLDSSSRMIWTLDAVSDASGPTAGVRNYLDQRTIRNIVSQVARTTTIRRACEVGCGYGRVIMVLKEFTAQVKGFEREEDLVRIARTLLPDIEFERVPALTEVRDSIEYDLAMMCTVLQHLSDDEARRVCNVLRSLAPRGHVLLIEKTDPFHITDNTTDGARFISRARSVDTYTEYMKPFTLVSVTDRILEPTYANPRPGSCMLFRSPELHSA